MGSLGVYGIVIGAWASNNKFSLLGGVRGSAQMISYEIAMGLSVMGILMVYGTLELQEIARDQGDVDARSVAALVGLSSAHSRLAAGVGNFSAAAGLFAFLHRRRCRNQTHSVRYSRRRVRSSSPATMSNIPAASF